MKGFAWRYPIRNKGTVKLEAVVSGSAKQIRAYKGV